MEMRVYVESEGVGGGGVTVVTSWIMGRGRHTKPPVVVPVYLTCLRTPKVAGGTHLSLTHSS